MSSKLPLGQRDAYAANRVIASYVRRSPENEAEYAALSRRIADEGVRETFQGRPYRYWYPGDGFKYWGMGHVINRAEV